MHWNRKNSHDRYELSESVEIYADDGIVFEKWTQYEHFPRFMASVRRTKQIDDERVMWDVDLEGHQMVWEARITETTPNKSIRWESSWGNSVSGEVRFERVDGPRTRLTVNIEYEPNTPLELLGARLGLADDHVRRDLERFRLFVESETRGEVANPGTT